MENLRPWSARKDEWFRLQRVIVKLVEIALEGEFVVGPDTLQARDELATASVSLGVVEPPLADASEFCLEPARNNIDGDTAFAVVVYARNLFCCHCRVPWSR